VLLRVGVVMMTIAVLFAGVVAVVVIVRGDPPEQAVATEHAEERATESSEEPARSYGSGKGPWVEKMPPPEPEPQSEWQPEPQSQSASQPQQQPEPQPVRQSQPQSQSQSEPQPLQQPRSGSGSKPQPEQQSQSGPETSLPAALPGPVEEWPTPKASESDLINEPRHFEVPPGAIMSLTVEAMGIYNVPVFSSNSQWALDNGIQHVPETSLPWTNTEQKNVYLAGHRLGYEGTDSRLVFYELDELGVGDEVVLKDRQGELYRYRVSETFLVGPADTWVMGEVRGRDMVTLQTCTPIPTFEQRIIVRADRV
jgi:sortase A